MNLEKLISHIRHFIAELGPNPSLTNDRFTERLKRAVYYQGYSKERILTMTDEDVYDYLSQLWAMLIWGNKHYVVDKILSDNTLPKFRIELAKLLYDPADIESRWNHFRQSIKGMGPAMMSEILCHTFPGKYMLWNRRAYVALDYLEVANLPTYDYQLTGKRYNYLSQIGQEIAMKLKENGFIDPDLLVVDYFIWDELQVIDNLAEIHRNKVEEEEIEKSDGTEIISAAEFKHNDIRDKLAAIGQFLGFTADTEKKVANGAVVDTIWEATIGNMGRVIYVFEVQTNGSIDSLILNLLKAANNSAVQGLVAVSDITQIEKIKREAEQIPLLGNKLKYWDYQEVLQVHDQLALSYSTINKLGLVPQGF